MHLYQESWLRHLWIALCISAAFFVLLNTGNFLDELLLYREQKTLLSANSPAVFFAKPAVTITSTNCVLLPNGQLARFNELSPQGSSNLCAEVTRALQTIQAQRVGYAIVGMAPDGTPLIQLWALSPRAYFGICGNSSYKERCESRMLLWRNVGAWLAQNSNIPVTSAGQKCDISINGR